MPARRGQWGPRGRAMAPSQGFAIRLGRLPGSPGAAGRPSLPRGALALGGLLLLLLPALLVPADARAAACCVSATSFGVGRLLIWEDFAVGLQLGHARLLGQWDPGGTLHRNPPGYSEGITHAQVWTILRLHQRVEAQGWLPVLVNDRWSAQTHQIAGGIGDAGAAARFLILAIGEFQGLPSLALTVGGFAPTGRRVEQTSPPLFAGTTGRGAWGGSLALESEYAPSPWFVRLEVGATAFLAFTRADTGQREQYGPSVRACLGSGRELVPGKLVAALALLGEMDARLKLDGVAIADSESRLVTLSASLAWRIDPHWTWVNVVSNSAWPHGFGKNLDARVDFTMGVRYGYF